MNWLVKNLNLKLGTMSDEVKKLHGNLEKYTTEIETLRTERQKKTHDPKFWLQHSDYSVARDMYIAASGSISQETTKFSLVCSKAPSREEVASICHALQKPCEQLVQATQVALYSGAGPSLTTEITKGTIAILQSVQVLCQGIESQNFSRIPEFTGRVWDTCKAVANLPKSNCIASKRTMLQCINMLTDTINDLNQLLEDANENGEDEIIDGLNAIDFEDEYSFNSKLSTEEKEVFTSGLKFLKMIDALLRRGVQALKPYAISESDTNLPFLHWTALLDQCFHKNQQAIVNFGAALYAPIDAEELGEALDKQVDCGNEILQCLLVEPQLNDKLRNEIETGLSRFTKQVEEVRDHLRTLDT